MKFSEIQEGLANKSRRYRVFFISVIALSLLYALLIILRFVFLSPNTAYVWPDYMDSNYRLFDLHIPKDLNFCGEKVPQHDFNIKECLEKEFAENGYWKLHGSLLFSRIQSWFAVIEPILKKNNIPDDVKYIALIESHLSNAVSPQQAVGFWQLIESTAKNYGLEITGEIDERYHVEKSTEAACKYFHDAYGRFHNWTLAAASYNLGMNGIEAQLKKQGISTYYDLLLNSETGRYIYRLLAVKMVIEHPENFGFPKRKKLRTTIPRIQLKVDTSIHNLEAFAEQRGYPLRVLKIFNPWLRANSLTRQEKKTYLISLPQKEYLNRNFDELENELLTTVSKTDSMLPDSVFITEDSSPLEDNFQKIIHKVEKGESLHGIAEKYGVKAEQIRKWNNLDEKKEPEHSTEIIIFQEKKTPVKQEPEP